MKKTLAVLAAFAMMLLLAPSVLAEEEVFALPAEAVVEETAFALGEEPASPTVQSDDQTADVEPVLTASDDGEGSDPGEELIDRVVTISLKDGVEITKVYDKTRNVKISSSSFAIDETNVADGDRVRISEITAAYDSPKAGERTVTLTFQITQTSDTYNYILDPATITVPATITPKTLTITPSADQGKVCGEADPTINARVSGLMSGDTVTGQLSREPGEAVGSYRITLGTIAARSAYDDEGESSYVINLLEGYFVIAPHYGVIHLPEDVTEIREEAFAGIAAAEVIVPDGCTSIGRRAFADCPWMQSIFIPGSVEIIDDTAFENSSNVVITTDSPSIKDWADALGIPCLTTYSDPDETPSPDSSQTPLPSVTPQP